MTLDFYDLKEEPFGFLPDSRFLFLTATHRETLGSLLLALQAGRGFVTLMAQPGLGKTTLLFHTLHSFGDRVVTVYLFQAPRTPVDLLRAVLTDLGVHTIDSDEEGMFSQLREVLLETHRRGKRVFIVIDEAQKIDGTVFYLLCTLANQVTLGAKVIQFILCGQPALAGRLAEIGPVPSMECGAAASLEPLSAQDTAHYVDHRLRTAGYRRESPLFTSEAAALVAHYSRGTPRNINHLCFETLSTAYRYRRSQIGADIVEEAAATLGLAEPQQKTLVATPLPVLTPPHVAAKNTARPLPQPQAVPATAAFSRPSTRKSSQKRNRTREASFPAKPQKVTSAPGVHKKKAAAVPAGASAPLQAAVRSPKAAAKLGVRPVLALTKAKNELKLLPKMSERSRQKSAVQDERVRGKRVPTLQSRRAARTLAARAIPGLTIAAVLLVAFTSAVFAMYQTQTVHSAGTQSITASALPHSYGPTNKRERTPAPTAKLQASKSAPLRAAPMHNLKGMDLESALRALSTRKQRQQHY